MGSLLLNFGISPSSSSSSYNTTTFTTSTTALFYLFFNHKKPLNCYNSSSFCTSKNLLYNNHKVTKIIAAAELESSVSGLLEDDKDEVIKKVSAAKDSIEALEVIAEMTQRSGGAVSTSDCCSIISVALDRNNADLALSIFSAMRSTFFDQGAAVGEKGPSVERWRWSRPDVHTYTQLVWGLAASLRVSDALRIIANVCRVGVSPSEEVPFGKIVRCPSCMIAVAVAQPQHGIQACI